MAKLPRATLSAGDFNASRRKWLSGGDGGDRGPNSGWEVIFDSKLPPGAAEILRHMEEEKRHKAQMRELRAIREAVASPALPPSPSPPAKKPPAKKHRERRGPQTTSVGEALREAYPPHGKAPAGLRFKEIETDIYPYLRRRHRKIPHRRTIMDAVKEMGRS